jgi:ABC-type multidrug transport system ATPase subunit
MLELTVRQALTFASRLRLSGTSEFKQQRVEELLGQMHLKVCADFRFGGGLVRGVSGGQRKRVCIATELIARPTFLFCDEPTSGSFVCSVATSVF